jgi:RecG-like helicase
VNLLPGALARRGRQTPPAPSATRLIADLRPQSRVVVKGMIRSAGTVTVRSGLAFHFTLVDGSGELDVLFPGQTRRMPGLQPGARITVEGTVGAYDCKLALWNPRYRIEPAD